MELGKSLCKNIERFVALDADEKKAVLQVFRNERYPKKTTLLQQGGGCRDFYYVESGSLRGYHCDARGKETTVKFAISDWWITDMGAFTEGTPALMTLETLEPASVWMVGRTELEDLLLVHPKLERYFRMLYQRAYIREQLRVLDAISLSVEERYSRFVAKYPDISIKVTQRQIASYLGVTPEFLSSVKKK